MRTAQRLAGFFIFIFFGFVVIDFSRERKPEGQEKAQVQQVKVLAMKGRT